jgi:hypothetical protein
MKFQIRKTVEHDIGLYKKCLENDEFRWFLYGNNKLNIEESTFYRGKRHQKFIVSRINDDDIEDMGFCDFYYNQDIEEYIYSVEYYQSISIVELDYSRMSSHYHICSSLIL